MRRARIYVNNTPAALLEEVDKNKYVITYDENYQAAPISLTIPLNSKHHEFNQFPPFFEGLLPEGVMLEALLRRYKLDRSDYFSQLMQVGQDMVGAVTVEEIA